MDKKRIITSIMKMVKSINSNFDPADRYYADFNGWVKSEEFRKGQPLDSVEYNLLKEDTFPVRDCEEHSEDSNDVWYIETFVPKNEIIL